MTAIYVTIQHDLDLDNDDMDKCNPCFDDENDPTQNEDIGVKDDDTASSQSGTSTSTSRI
jgi:hypothetical protein